MSSQKPSADCYLTFSGNIKNAAPPNGFSQKWPASCNRNCQIQREVAFSCLTCAYHEVQRFLGEKVAHQPIDIDDW